MPAKIRFIPHYSIVFTLIGLSIVLLLSMGSCSPFSDGSDTGAGSATTDDSAQPQPINWSVDADCAGCHVTEGVSTSDSACLASVHSDQNLSCQDCHDDIEGLTAAHDNADSNAITAKRLKETAVEGCTACHNLTDLAMKTESATLLTDSNGTVVNPHQLPETQEHGSMDAACTECHSVHDAEANIESDSTKYCSNCHHAGVYECNTCH